MNEPRKSRLVTIVSYGIQFFSVLYIVLGVGALFIFGSEPVQFDIDELPVAGTLMNIFATAAMFLSFVLPITLFGLPVEFGFLGGNTTNGLFTILAGVCLVLGLFTFWAGRAIRKRRIRGLAGYGISVGLLLAGLSADAVLQGKLGFVGDIDSIDWIGLIIPQSFLLLLYITSAIFLWYKFIKQRQTGAESIQSNS